MKVNQNYTKINVAAQQNDANSVLNFYKKMIQMKKAIEVFTYGTYDLLLDEDPQIYAYTRTMDGERGIIIINLSTQSTEMKVGQGVSLEYSQLLLNNYEVSEHEPLNEYTLKPYEVRVYRV
ncbi:alpha-glucosidase C-terminal domain-containing protein [Bacillaceae bacterium C204]|uniref:alpha-glucosidase C-terminal domain-containing protein n=1 Tax=Neobacillus sp. 204 TaxID=3383351 RepID=UPI00397C5367